MRILSLILMILSQSAFGAAGGGVVALSEETKVLIEGGKLIWAAQAGNIDAVEILLKKGANLNLDLVNKEGKTALMLATENGHVEIANLLREVEDTELIAIEAEKEGYVYSIKEVTATEDGYTCVIKYSNGDVYRGQMGERGVPHGRGELWNKSARKVVSGHWCYGYKSGQFHIIIHEGEDRSSPVVSRHNKDYYKGRCVSSDKDIDLDEVLDAPYLVKLQAEKYQ